MINWESVFNYWKRVDELLEEFADEVKLEWLSTKLQCGNTMTEFHNNKANKAKEEIDRLLDMNPENYQVENE